MIIASSRIYQYHLDNLTDTGLHIIIATAANDYTDYANCLLAVYARLIKQDRIDIMTAIAIGANDNDEIILAICAIDHNRIDIIDLLVGAGFVINQLIVKKDDDDGDEHSKLLSDVFDKCGSLISYALKSSNCKFPMYCELVDRGADPLHFDTDKFYCSTYGCGDEYVQYFIDMGIPAERLNLYLRIVLSTYCYRSKDKKSNVGYMNLIDYGCSLDFSTSPALPNMAYPLSCLPVSDFAYLHERGLNLGDNKITFMRCVLDNGNENLFAYIMENGYEINEALLLIIFNDGVTIRILNILSRYDVDYSCVKPKRTYDDLYQKLEQQGLDRVVLLDWLLADQ